MRLPRPALLGLGVTALAVGLFAAVPVVQAQFFWSPFFQEERPKPKPRKPAAPPGDDLPPIVPKESSAPPPPDDRPYDVKLLRLAEILGAVHYLRELCGAQEGQLWRNQMQQILKNEGSTAARRAKLVNSFNDGYRGYRRTYRTCTSSATLAVTRFSTEGAQIAQALAQPSGAYPSRNASVEPAAATATDASAAPAPAADANAAPKQENGASAAGESPAGEGETAMPSAEKPSADQGATKPVESGHAAQGNGKKAGRKAKAAASQQVDRNQPPD